ncbi:O-methyltransferase-domain-containing protein [Geopyxis carbonaria]|nr:O-methyltransferase-domain-containing protein [Geopyxis carbonaria]
MTSPTLESSLANLTAAVATLISHGGAPPTLDVSSPTDLWDAHTPPLAAAKVALTDAAHELLLLANGPKATLTTMVMQTMEVPALRALLALGVFEHIPLAGSVHVRVLSQLTNVPEEKLLRLLRATAVTWVFAEGEEGVFRHTALSAVLRRDREPALAALAAYVLDEAYKGSSQLAEWLQETPRAEISVESPIARVLGMPLFEYFAANPEKGKRFAEGMKGASQLQLLTSELLPAWFRRAPLSETRKMVIDLGGGNGHISAGLAEEFPDLTFTILDRQPTPETSPYAHVAFQFHDFFTPLPETLDFSTIKAVFIRRCLHNWSDIETVRILRNIVPLLRDHPEVRLLLNEGVTPPHGVLPKSVERSITQLDIMMMVVVNSKQRNEKKWREIVEMVDPNLQVVGVETAGSLGLVEIRYQS